jgi:Skp family chaperone for outer membrane proteins
MNSARTTLIILIAAACGAILFTAVPAISQGVSAQSKIRFVDLSVIFNKYDKANGIRSWVNSQRQVIDLAKRDSANKLQKQVADLEILVPGTPAFAAKKRELDRLDWELRYDDNEKRAALGRAAVKRMGLIYTEIRREAQNYARRNGLTAVFMVNEQDIPAQSPEELQAMIATRPVLYHDKALDITTQILGILQAKKK